MLAVELHPAAAAEIEDADAWYHAQNPRAAEAYRAELGRVIEAVRRDPERWPRLAAGLRRQPLRWFPFSLVYRAEPDRILVIAVAHHRRKPGYWRARTRS